MEPFLFSLALSAVLFLSIRSGDMSDRKKIETIFERTGISLPRQEGGKDKPSFIRKEKLDNGMEYVYRLPLGMPYAKLEYLEGSVGVFKDGLHKNVEFDFDGGMVHVFVYETDLPESWDFKEVIKDESDNG